MHLELATWLPWGSSNRITPTSGSNISRSYSRGTSHLCDLETDDEEDDNNVLINIEDRMVPVRRQLRASYPTSRSRTPKSSQQENYFRGNKTERVEAVRDLARSRLVYGI
ncbi:hypothetical protein Tco_1381214 [Tanacetum coccineum]